MFNSQEYYFDLPNTLNPLKTEEDAIFDFFIDVIFSVY